MASGDLTYTMSAPYRRKPSNRYMLERNSRSVMTIRLRRLSNVWHDAMIDIATVTFWCIEIVPVGTPRIGARRSPVVRPISHQPSCQARTPRLDHSSANCWRYVAVRFGIAPSEWLTRYVQESTIGNSERHRSRASPGIAKTVSLSTPNHQLPTPKDVGGGGLGLGVGNWNVGNCHANTRSALS